MLEIAGGIILAVLFLILLFAFFEQIVVVVATLFALAFVLAVLAIIYIFGGLDGVVATIIVLGLIFGFGYWNSQQDKQNFETTYRTELDRLADTSIEDKIRAKHKTVKHKTSDIVLGYIVSFILLLMVIGFIVAGYHLL